DRSPPRQGLGARRGAGDRRGDPGDRGRPFRQSGRRPPPPGAADHPRLRPARPPEGQGRVTAETHGGPGGGRGGERPSAPRSPVWIARFRDAGRRVAERLLGTHVLWSGVFVAVTLTMLTSQRCGRAYPHLALGEPSPFDVRAIEDVEVPDEVATLQRKTEA